MLVEVSQKFQIHKSLPRSGVQWRPKFFLLKKSQISQQFKLLYSSQLFLRIFWCLFIYKNQQEFRIQKTKHPNNSCQNSAHELSLSTVKIAQHDFDHFFKLLNFRKKSIVFILYQSKCPRVPILSKFGDAKKVIILGLIAALRLITQHIGIFILKST